MYNDAPFDFGLFKHDNQITTPQLCAQSKQYDAINTNANHVWVVIHKPRDTNIVMEAMEQRNYKNITQFYWVKPNHYVEGPAKRLTSAVEIGTVGYMADADHVPWYISDNPRDRANYISMESVLTHARDSAGNTINRTEKPPGLAKWLLGMWCPKGSTILMVGTGAGGCLKGAIMAGLNVVGVENDETQFRQLYSEMNAWVANLEKEKKAVLVKPPPQGKTEKTPAPVKPIPTQSISAPEEPEPEDPTENANVCFSCEQAPTEEDPLMACSECSKMCHTINCMVPKPPAADGTSSLSARLCSGCKMTKYPDVSCSSGTQ